MKSNKKDIRKEGAFMDGSYGSLGTSSNAALAPYAQGIQMWRGQRHKEFQRKYIIDIKIIWALSQAF